MTPKCLPRFKTQVKPCSEMNNRAVVSKIHFTKSWHVPRRVVLADVLMERHVWSAINIEQ